MVSSQLNKVLVPKSPGSAQERGHVRPLVVCFAVSFPSRIQATWSQHICQHKALRRGQVYCSVDLLRMALCDQRRLGNLHRPCWEGRAAESMAVVLMPAAQLISTLLNEGLANTVSMRCLREHKPETASPS